ncbi:ATP-binding cassette domain-containing protein [Acidisoma sp. S159]|uniref:ATP-binding cassette domain-containing protein n=1 Tax=Acidisoma sp. S159 TaxID=1747225 RepID=UPI00131A96FB|nr:sugar ABC transporter ATP-binding protein [Acidisoma sp. S159]
MALSTLRERPTLELRAAAKSFGPVRALRGTDFSIVAGDVVGLVGHNGAGKSTLMNIIAGVVGRDAGDFLIGGTAIGADYSPAKALRHGVRCVFQELSLCRNLDLAENTRMLHASLRGFGWRGRAGRLIHGMLEDIFPEHGIPLRAKVEDLSLAERQMVEIARAYTDTDLPARFVILDEPTSSLGHEATAQLLRFIRRAADRGVASILISHRLDEILEVCDRVVVMVDGEVVGRREAAGLRRRDLVGMMGHIETPLAEEATRRSLGIKRIATPGTPGQELPIEASAGEVVGFAGLDGHGQRERLRMLFFAAGGEGEAAYVAGDRGAEGVFPLWSICENMTIRSIAALRDGLLISRVRERVMARDWVDRMKVKTDGIDRLLTTLSGGNQQKVLFARALATDAPIIFLDDPMRGVDVGTKREVYRMIREEAAAGRCFVWFASEIEEMANCDTVYIFHQQRATTRLQGTEVTSARIVQASFGEDALV